MVVSHARRDIDPLAPTRLLDLAVDLLPPLPLACELEKSIPRAVRNLGVAVEFIAMVMVEGLGVLVCRRCSEPVRKGNAALKPVPQARVLRTIGRELVQRTGSQPKWP